MSTTTKRKIINDPVYGFLSIKTDLIFDVIQHPFFQRLRRIKQLGLTNFVYPGAQHTRFQHAMGAMHLMGVCLDVLRTKGQEISEQEYEAAQLAILLHDIGHGPFSHALETTILQEVEHERMSQLLMERLNQEFGGQLQLALDIFSDQYPRRFFHQLVSSQLDMDRLDYLQRDCFFTGVIEGKVAFDRILNMLDVHEDQIVVEYKGIYSIENFLNARRLMYWQVYLHKTTVSTEQMLIQIIRRARDVAQEGHEVFATPGLGLFLKNNVGWDDFQQHPEYLTAFASLDDSDVWCGVKVWVNHPDRALSELSRMLLNRKLFRVEFSDTKHEKDHVRAIRQQLMQQTGFSKEEAKYFCTSGKIFNSGYIPNDQNILIKTKKGEILDVAKASDLPNIEALSRIVKKYFLCYPKSVIV